VLSLVVLLGCVAYLLGTSRLRAGWRMAGVALCAAIVCTVAYSRMYLDAHWFSDVLGGFSIGFAYLLAVIWWMRAAPELAPTGALDAVLAEPAEVPALAVGCPEG
jgi:undecaprenyl-diphosphatase